jgi:NADPH2:quinone reductase
MRGWLMHREGEPTEVMELVDLPDRVPADDQLVVEVEAAGITFPDLLLIRGDYQFHLPLPNTPGSELVGRVVAAGPRTRIPVGARVAGLARPPDGAFAQQTLVVEDDVIEVPEDLPAADAVTLQTNYVTAHLALHHRAKVQQDEFVLVHGAAGGVGSAAVQLARAQGARVIATEVGPNRVALCERLGAERVIDPTTEPLVAAVMEATEGHGADIVIDTVGGDLFDDSRRCIAFEGRIVVVGFTSGRIPELRVNQLILRNFTVMGVNALIYANDYPDLNRWTREAVIALRMSCAIAPVIDGVSPFEDVPEVFARLAAGEVIGKAIVAMS